MQGNEIIVLPAITIVYIKIQCQFVVMAKL